MLRKRCAKRGLRRLEVPQVTQRCPEIPVRHRRIRLQGDRRLQDLRSQPKLPLAAICDPEVDECVERTRSELEDPLKGCYRFIEPSELQARIAEAKLRIRLRRIQLHPA